MTNAFPLASSLWRSVWGRLLAMHICLVSHETILQMHQTHITSSIHNIQPTLNKHSQGGGGGKATRVGGQEGGGAKAEGDR